MVKPGFTVIIPARNEAALISRAIQSVRRQEYPEDQVEIIVVDNGSTDATAIRAREAGADVVVTEKTIGTNMARQRGVLESRGRYLAFLDADCVAPPHWLTAIDAHLQTRADLVSGPHAYDLGGISGILTRLCFRLAFRAVTPILKIVVGFRCCPVMGGNFACTRALLNHIGGLPRLPFWGDDTAISVLAEHFGGRVVFDPQLVVVSSARRFHRDGFLITSARYVYHYLRIALFPTRIIASHQLQTSAFYREQR
jgi:glycosyltransferase involved in cell wall biosynthesis